jgi:hypothetical protein
VSYAADHAGALADIQAAGASVTFSRTSPGTYNGPAGTFSSATTTSVAGAAVQVTGNTKRYAELGLVEANTRTLLFAPTTYGASPDLGMACTWGGEEFVVRDAPTLAPDGSAILSRVVVSR